MSVHVRDCIVCLPAYDVKKPPREGAVLVMCGLCRENIWSSPKYREKFTRDPDRYVMACVPCAFDLYKTMVDRQPDLRLDLDDQQLVVDLKGRKDPGDQAIVMPTWLIDGVDLDLPEHRCAKCDPTFKEEEQEGDG